MNRSHLRWVPYAFIAALAVAGQYLAGVAHLHPANLLEQAAILAVAVGIEGMAVWLAYLADRRGRVGERALPYRIISALFAALAVGINTAGHWPELYLVAVFGGFSIAGYTVWCIESITALRDSWDPDGRVRSRVPAWGLLKFYEKDPRIVSRARLIAQTHAEANPDAAPLGPVTALQQARDALAVDARRATLRKVIRQGYQLAGLGANDVDMALLAYGTEQVAAALMNWAENDGLAAALLHNIRPARLIGVTDAAWDKLAGQIGGPPSRPAGTVPQSRPTGPARPAGRKSASRRKGSDLEKIERLDESYEAYFDEHGVPPAVRSLAQLADVPRSTTGRWLKAKLQDALTP